MDGFPITELGAAAAQVHELYCEFLAVGFTEEQAFELTKITLEGQNHNG